MVSLRLREKSISIINSAKGEGLEMSIDLAIRSLSLAFKGRNLNTIMETEISL
jgi:hypothetical protein